MLTLKSLALTNIRCLSKLSIDFAPEFTLIHGPNGTGKTSILEAIYLLSCGRSFRTKHKSHLITHNAAAFTLFAEVEEDKVSKKIGLQYTNANKATLFSVNGEKSQNLAHLAQQMPTHLINHASFDLIESAPSFRREFIDWLCFYSDPEFNSTWQRYRVALKQRNAALKIPGQNYTIWNKEYAELGEIISQKRRSRLQNYNTHLHSFLQANFPYPELQIEYEQGWPEDLTLAETLGKLSNRDERYGTSNYGPHRADLKLSIDGIAANQILSRGQIKLLFCLMLLARAVYLREINGRKGIFLIDDLSAELDAKRQELFFNFLQEYSFQAVITGLNNITDEKQTPYMRCIRTQELYPEDAISY